MKTEKTQTDIVNTTLGSATNIYASYGGIATSDQGSGITIRGVCRSTSPNPTIADSCTSDGSGTRAFQSTITGLAPNTTYYVRAYATNANGATYATEDSFTTVAQSSFSETTNVPHSTQAAFGNLPATGSHNTYILAVSIIFLLAGLMITSKTKRRTLLTHNEK